MNTHPGYRGFRVLEKRQGAQDEGLYNGQTFPAHGRYALSSQLLNASRSITNNIAEGYGRFSYTDTRHFFIQPRGRLQEPLTSSQ
jgi:four helix bundle protein